MATAKKAEAASTEAASSAVKDAVKDDKKTVEVRLAGAFEAFKNGIHEHYADGRLLARFDHGVAVVEADVAKLLKELGVAK
jgi:hypothetical protein